MASTPIAAALHATRTAASRLLPGLYKIASVTIFNFLLRDPRNVVFFIYDYMLFGAVLYFIPYDIITSFRTWTGSIVEVFQAMGLLFWTQAAFVVATCAFGIIGPKPVIYRLHVGVALLRVVISLASGAWLYTTPRLGFYRAQALQIATIFLFSSMLHLIGAYRRYHNAIIELTAALENPLDMSVNKHGFRMCYFEAQQHKQQQVASRQALARSEVAHQSGCLSGFNRGTVVDGWWHHPQIYLDPGDDAFIEYHDPSTRWWSSWMLGTRKARAIHFDRLASIRGGMLDSPTASSAQHYHGLFARCNCCLQTDADLHDTAQESLRDLSDYRRQVWINERDSFLSRDAHVECQGLHFDLGMTRRNEATRAHMLCSSCSAVLARSNLLGLLHSMSWTRLWSYVKLTMCLRPLVEEHFVLHQSVTGLLRSVDEGCHLCHKIWDSLSPPQRESLTQRDRRIASLLTEQTRGAYFGHDASLLRAERAISLKILSPQHPEHAESSPILEMVPHFGRKSVARRWVDVKLVQGARTLGHDEAMEWDEEHVPPIRVRGRDITNEGPLELPIGTSTSSKIAMELVKAWILQHRHHNMVRGSSANTTSVVDSQQLLSTPAAPGEASTNRGYSSAESQGPTMLIGLHKIDTGTIKIIPTSGRQFRYAALSYCWGGTERTVSGKQRAISGPLTTYTLDQYLEAIDVNTLPVALQDAARLSHKLDLDYLWIDAMCIIQDDDVAKRAEIDRMEIIFSGAEIVIAAAAAWDSSTPIVVEQNPLAMTPCLLSASSTLEGPASALYALPAPKYCEARDSELRFSRLRSRGWVFQEEALATRLVYFASRQIHLQCNTCGHRMSQVPSFADNQWSRRRFPDMIAPRIFRYTQQLLFFSFFFPSISLPALKLVRRATKTPAARASSVTAGESAVELSLWTVDAGPPSEDAAHGMSARLLLAKIQQRWWNAVYKYSTRSLTQPQDKLPAIQGLANRTQVDFDCLGADARYFAGMWMGKRMATELLWYTDGSEDRPHRSVPSWSWACVEGVIWNQSLSGDPHPVKTGINIIRFPDASDSKLELQGKLKAASWRPRSGGDKQYYVGHSDEVPLDLRSAKYLADYVPYTREPTSGPEAHMLLDSSGVDVGLLVLDSTSDMLVSRSIYCLQIAVQPSSVQGEQDFAIPWATRGLALRKLSVESSTYSRIGLIELTRTNGGRAFNNAYSYRDGELYRDGYRSPAPDIDVAKFFSNVEPQVLSIV